MHPARLKALAAILHLQKTLPRHKGLGRRLKTSFQNVNLASDGVFSSTPHGKWLEINSEHPSWPLGSAA